MLIGFCGAGGTGKTTTAVALAKELHLPFIASSSRAIFTKRGIVEADQHKFTPEQQYELQMEIFEARETLEASTTEGVADRTLLDQVAYTLLRAAPVVDEQRLTDLMARAQKSLHKYDCIFYFPLVTFHGAEDGMRETGYGIRFNFASILQMLLRRAGIFAPPVPEMSALQRVQWIKARIGS